MSRTELTSLLERGAGPPPEEPDTDRLWRRGRRRRRVKRTGATAAGVAAVVLIGVAIQSIVSAPSPPDIGPVSPDGPGPGSAPAVLWWHDELGGGGVSDHGHWAIANDETVFTVDGAAAQLVAVDLAAGDERWRRPFDSQGDWLLPQVATDDVVMVAAKFHDVYGLDARSGRAIWQMQLDDGYGAASAAVTDNSVVVMAHAPTEGDHRPPLVVALDLSDGSVRWQTYLREGEAGQWAPPTIIDDRVIVRTTPDGDQQHSGVHALDVETGELLWTRDVGPALEDTSFTEIVTQSTGNLVHVPLPGPATATLNADTGDLVWETTDTWPLGGSDESLVMTDGQRTYAVDPGSGITLANGPTIDIPDNATWLIGIDNRDTILVPTREGAAAVDPASAQLSQHHPIPARTNRIILRGDILIVATQDRGVLAIDLTRRVGRD